jgi:hypothetical protein
LLLTTVRGCSDSWKLLLQTLNLSFHPIPSPWLTPATTHSQMLFTVLAIEQMPLCVWQHRCQIMKTVYCVLRSIGQTYTTFQLRKNLSIPPHPMTYNICANNHQTRTICSELEQETGHIFIQLTRGLYVLRL